MAAAMQIQDMNQNELKCTSQQEKSVRIGELNIPAVKMLLPARHGDHRGFFSEVYNRGTLIKAGIDIEFVQDNHSLSATRGTVRGLHFQTPPFAQDKLVRVVRGAVFDVAVDLRRGSPTYGRHVSVVLSAEAWNQVLVPIGFAHGFMTLEPDTEVIYKVSNYYAPDHDKGLLWNDPDLAIPWPFDEGAVTLSPKDKELPRLAEFDSPFSQPDMAGTIDTSYSQRSPSPSNTRPLR